MSPGFGIELLKATPSRSKPCAWTQLLRIQNEAAILMRMAKDCPAVGVVAGPNFAAALAEALRDARAFRFSRLLSTTNPGAMPPGLFFDALSSIRCFPDFPNPFSMPIRMPGISLCKRKNMRAGVFASEAVVRTWSIQFPWLYRSDFYRSGLPTRTLAVHFAGTIRKKSFVHMQKHLLARFGNPCDVPFRSSGITRSPHKEKK